MKTYRVSIAVYVPANFEEKVRAESPEEAYAMVRRMFAGEEDGGELVDVDDTGAPLLANVGGAMETYLPDELSHIPDGQGVYVAELERTEGGTWIEKYDDEQGRDWLTGKEMLGA